MGERNRVAAGIGSISLHIRFDELELQQLHSSQKSRQNFTTPAAARIKKISPGAPAKLGLDGKRKSACQDK